MRGLTRFADNRMKNITIRIATDKDLPKVLELYSHPEIDGDKVLKLAEARTIFDKMKLYPDYNIYVAECADEIVGTFSLAIMDNICHSGAKSGLIEAVVVSENCQGQGVGKQMMDFAIEACRAKSCYKVELSSNIKRDMAHKFYEKIGFKFHGYSFLTEIKE